jgi:tRNA(adenine34) deaminase
VGTVVYAAGDPKRGALGGTLDLSRHPSAHHQMLVVADVRGELAGRQLEEWFLQRRAGRRVIGN